MRPFPEVRLPPSLRAAIEAEDRAAKAREIATSILSSSAPGNVQTIDDDDGAARTYTGIDRNAFARERFREGGGGGVYARRPGPPGEPGRTRDDGWSPGSAPRSTMRRVAYPVPPPARAPGPGDAAYTSSESEADDPGGGVSAWSTRGHSGSRKDTCEEGSGSGEVPKRPIAFVSDLLTPGQLGGGTFEGVQERMNVLPVINTRSPRRRFVFPPPSATMQRSLNAVADEQQRQRARRRQKSAAKHGRRSRASHYEQGDGEGARAAHESVSGVYDEGLAILLDLGDVGANPRRQRTRAISSSVSTKRPESTVDAASSPKPLKVEFPDVHSVGNGVGSRASPSSDHSDRSGAGVNNEAAIKNNTKKIDGCSTEEAAGASEHWCTLRDSVVTGAKAVNKAQRQDEEQELLDEMRDTAWETLMLFCGNGGGDGASNKPGRKASRSMGGGSGSRQAGSHGAYRYNSKNYRHTNRHRRVENVELAVKLMGKVQSRSQFWKGFTQEECKLMGSEVEIIRYKAGERLMRTGDQADFVALILSGGARVEVVAPQTGERRTAGVFGPGSLIGEMALWEGGIRSADVIATGRSVLGPGGSGSGGGGGNENPGETLVAQFHFDEFVDFFLRRPLVAMKLFQVFVQASMSKLKEWRLRTMIAHRTTGQGTVASAFVGVGGGGTGAGTTSKATTESTKATGMVGHSTREVRPVLVQSIPSKKVLELLRAAHGGSARIGRELNDLDLSSLSRRLQIVGGSEGVRILEAGQLAGSLLIVLQGAAESWRGGYKGGELLDHHGPGDVVNIEEFIEAFHGPHEQAADVIAVAPSTVCALLTVPNLVDLNATHPFLVFKVVCSAGEKLVQQLSARLEEVRATGAAGASKSPKSLTSPMSAEVVHQHPHPTFLRKVVERWKESQLEYLMCSGIDEDTMARLDVKVTQGGGSRWGKRDRGGSDKKRAHTGEALFDHYTGEFEFNAAQVASGEDCRHPLLAGRSPVELLHDVISFSPMFRGFTDREVAMLADCMTLVRVGAGRQIIRQGDEPTFMGLMVQGSASVVNAYGDIVAVLEPGTIIGEISLFEGGARQATVVSAENVTIVGAFTFEDLVSLAVVRPLLGLKVLMLCVRSAAARMHDNIVLASPREDFFTEASPLEEDEETRENSDAISGEKTDADATTGVDTDASAVDEEQGDGPGEAAKEAAVSTSPLEGLFRKHLPHRNIQPPTGYDVAKMLRSAHAAAANPSDPSHTGGLAEDMKDEDIATLAEYVKIRSFSPGQKIISEGQVGSAVLFITAGAMDVRVGGVGGALLETKRVGEYVGEAAYLEHGGGSGGGRGRKRRTSHRNGSTAGDPSAIRRQLRTADVVASVTEGASAAVLTYDALDSLCVEHPLLAMAVFTRMASLAMARSRQALSSVKVQLGGTLAGRGGAPDGARGARNAREAGGQNLAGSHGGGVAQGKGKGASGAKSKKGGIRKAIMEKQQKNNYS